MNKSLAAEEVDYGKIFSPNFSDVYRNEFSGQDHVEQDRERETASERHYGMYGDGMYHNILVMRQLPGFDLTPFYGNVLLETNVTNFSVTVNLRPLNKAKTIEKLESRQASAQRDLEADPSAIAYRSEVDAFGKMIYRMGAGEDVPFETEYLIPCLEPESGGTSAGDGATPAGGDQSAMRHDDARSDGASGSAVSENASRQSLLQKMGPAVYAAPVLCGDDSV